MCGIAGLVCARSDHHPDEHAPVVAKMCELQRHRGPDEEGVTCLGRACLGSNRLSIIDLSQAGRMPMSDADGDWWIVYNGEIYNYRALRGQLIERGYAFARDRYRGGAARFSGMGRGRARPPDRHVRLRHLPAVKRDAHPGARSVRQEAALLLLRGRPLIFASELKALLRVMRERRVDHRRLAEVALYRNVDWGASETLVEKVHSLLPGHWMQLTTVGPRRRALLRGGGAGRSRDLRGSRQTFGARSPRRSNCWP